MSSHYRVVVIGAGSIGERHVRCLQATGKVDVSICEPNEKVRDRVAEQYGLTSAYANIEQATALGFDMAVIATPAQLHVEQAHRFAEHGTHVLIEKPLSTSLTGVAELKHQLLSSGLTAGVAFPYRAHPVLAAMRLAIHEGQFGAPLEVVTVAGQHFPTYRPAFRDTYYRRHETGGGAIQDALPHLINAVEWLVGPTTRVVGDAGRLRLDGVEVEDTTHVLARNGQVLASYSLNQHQPANETTITVVCERGQARFEYHRSCWSWVAEVDGTWHVHSHDNLQRDDIFRRQADAFISAVAGNGQPLCSLDEAVVTLKAVMAILRSLETSCWESLEE